MKQLKKSYLDNYDLLIALITHLSVTKYKSRTPTKIARSLGLLADANRVNQVLNGFQEFFRRSNNIGQDTKEYFYTVHLRYALRRKNGEITESPPLDPSDISVMIQQVSEMVRLEQEKHLTEEEIKKNYENLILSINNQNELASKEFKIKAQELENSNKLTQRNSFLTLIVAIIATLTAILVPVIENLLKASE